MQRDLKIEWFFPHPPGDVWECLTNPEMVGQWLMKNDFKPVVGHRFNFYTKPMPKMRFDGIVYCEVLEIIPEEKLVYTWKGGPAPGIVELDTLLVWTLIPAANGTTLVLEHKGFRGFKNMIASIFMNNGWRKGIARRFRTVLNNYIHGITASRHLPGNC
jgi:uncharacterized protein YndB with AHSA1/START domain